MSEVEKYSFPFISLTPVSMRRIVTLLAEPGPVTTEVETAESAGVTGGRDSFFSTTTSYRSTSTGARESLPFLFSVFLTPDVGDWEVLVPVHVLDAGEHLAYSDFIGSRPYDRRGGYFSLWSVWGRELSVSGIMSYISTSTGMRFSASPFRSSPTILTVKLFPL